MPSLSESEELWEGPPPPKSEPVDDPLEPEIDPATWVPDPAPPNLKARRRGTLSKKPQRPRMPISPQQKLLLLDIWQRSGLPARDFGALVDISRHTLYAWKRRFEQEGPAGLMDKPKGSKKGSRLSEITKRTILMLKTAHPDWGCQRISDMLLRGPACQSHGGCSRAARGGLRDGGASHATSPSPSPII